MDLEIQESEDSTTLSLCVSFSQNIYPKNCSQCQPIKEYIYRFPSQNRDLLLEKIEEHGIFKENKGKKHQGNEFMNLSCNDLKEINDDDFVSACELSGFGNLLSQHPHVDFKGISANEHCTHLHNLVNQSCTLVCDEEASKLINYCRENCNNFSQIKYNDCADCETYGTQIFQARNSIAQKECEFDSQCKGIFGDQDAYCDSKGRCIYP